MNDNTKVIQKFYDAFKAGDAETMAACYHPDIRFEDPVFGKLSGDEVGDMWRMLLSGAKNLHLEYFDAAADGDEGSARWHATYTFSKTGRTVNNKIKAHFKFKEGKIIEHKDSFNFWKWSSMALGPVGTFLGFTPFLRNKVSAQTLKLLKSYREKRK